MRGVATALYDLATIEDCLISVGEGGPGDPTYVGRFNGISRISTALGRRT
jgi:hypothetical protein